MHTYVGDEKESKNGKGERTKKEVMLDDAGGLVAVLQDRNRANEEAQYRVVHRYSVKWDQESSRLVGFVRQVISQQT